MNVLLLREAITNGIVDDCWSVKSGRDDKTHQIIPDPAKFPDGIRGTADKIHALGLNIGIYSSKHPACRSR
jgi:hypothetical protein